jgi:uncharacterized protein (DUF3820 family)/mRNA-degrading endonuclease HigB of HigAB toxin-antitoxin module
MADINTHNLVIDFGKYRGSLWTHVPVSYLKWLANQVSINGSKGPEIARCELKRRGTMTPTIEVSGHAIDSASLRLRRLWHETAENAEEGLHAWLCRMAKEAFDAPENRPGPMHTEFTVIHLDVKWVFAVGELYPTLLSVMPR